MSKSRRSAAARNLESLPNMFSYYGSKSNVVRFYPPPKYGKVIEPFAGSARYALRYFDREVLLVDKYEVIIRIWRWLQLCSQADILRLPRLQYGERLDQYSFDCEEARMFMGFLMGFSAESPRHQATIKLKQRPNFINFSLERIAKSLFKIKNWQIVHGSYEWIHNEEASWFIDPPYETMGGSGYIEGSDNIDFGFLREWCLSRKGQIIVCEAAGATWMDFKPLKRHRTRNGWQKELIYTNEITSTISHQFQLFST